ncbi:MAG: hypothetical protein DRJ56_04505 [Thermoprotei archaeon]|nr:MAG: hypothetical protein DRJ56_04505 [Thermoprotei archaeon]
MDLTANGWGVALRAYVLSKSGLPEALCSALDACGVPRELGLVLVKPNVCGFYPPDPAVLRALLDYLVERAEMVVIGETESAMHKPADRFRALGLHDVASAYGGRVRLEDLTEGPKVKVEVPRGRAVSSLPLPRLLLEADYLVNLARIGSHPSTTITAALKNLFGLVAARHKYVRYHPRGMDKVVADVAKVVKPDVSVVEVGEEVVVASDPLVADVVASERFGVNPLSVRHLRMVAEDRGLDLEALVEAIEVVRL